MNTTRTSYMFRVFHKDGHIQDVEDFVTLEEARWQVEQERGWVFDETDVVKIYQVIETRKEICLDEGVGAA